MLDVLRVAGDNRVAVLDQKGERGVDNVAGSRTANQAATVTSRARVERTLQEAIQGASEPRLSGWIAPRLGHARSGRNGLDAACCRDGKQCADLTFAAVQGD
jgi:hypothetical protein